MWCICVGSLVLALAACSNPSDSVLIVVFETPGKNTPKAWYFASVQLPDIIPFKEYTPNIGTSATSSTTAGIDVTNCLPIVYATGSKDVCCAGPILGCDPWYCGGLVTFLPWYVVEPIVKVGVTMPFLSGCMTYTLWWPHKSIEPIGSFSA